MAWIIPAISWSASGVQAVVIEITALRFFAFSRCLSAADDRTAAPKGNRNNFRHRRYSDEAIAGRRKIRELVPAMRALARQEQV